MINQIDEILAIEDVAAYLKASKKRAIYRLCIRDLGMWVASRFKAIEDNDEGAE